MESELVLLIVACIILLMSFTYYIYEFIKNSTRSQYDNLPGYYSRDKSRHKRKCPKGCLRGACMYGGYCNKYMPPNEACCAFDFQCVNCRDKSTDKVYFSSESSNLPEIEQKYYQKVGNKYIKNLNKSIKKENKYIGDLNKIIRKKNKDILSWKS
jgi:hypothetical protein